MNAIAAVFGASGIQAARAAVTQMLDRMPERGPGHRVIVADDPCVIGAAGPAPAFASKADCALLAGDLRLDNAAELRQLLSLDAGTAPEVIALEAYARWGDDFAARLAGDFALTIFDRPGRRLLAVRDPLGIRPLYYRSGTNHLRCASELRALVEPADAPDEGYLAEVLSGDIVDTEGTPYLLVKRVPAGHMLIVSADGERVIRYWEPPSAERRGSREEYAERFRAAFDDAVRDRCADRSRIGVQLSGGLDSSSVLGTVCDLACGEPVAASLRFPWPEADEASWIAAAARRWSIDPIAVTPPVDPPAHDLRSSAATFDIPDAPTGVPLQEPLQRAMKDAGAEIVLTGFGGDQWWSGEMAYLADLTRRLRLGELRRWRAARASRGEEIAWSWPSFMRDGLLPLVPPFARRTARHLLPRQLPAWIDGTFARRVSLRDRLRRRPDTTNAPSESWRRMRWRLDSGEEAFVKERLDRLSAVSGIELRHPFYDRRLVEAAFEMPQDARFGASCDRAVVRDAMAPRLAPETLGRTTKADLSRLLVEGARAAEVQPYLRFDALTKLGWIDRSEAGALTRRVVEHGNEDAAASLWRVIGVEAWLRERFEAR